MKTVVLDTSALLRFYIPDEPVPQGLERLMADMERDEAVVIVPELLLVETAQVLYKKQTQNILNQTEATRLLEEITGLPLHVARQQEYILDAYLTANRLDISVYDALFVALAQSFSAILITADLKLQQASLRDGVPVTLQ